MTESAHESNKYTQQASRNVGRTHVADFNVLWTNRGDSVSGRSRYERKKRDFSRMTTTYKNIYPT